MKLFLDNKLGFRNYVFQQDNASIHVSKLSKQWLERNFSAVLEWPAKSPDLNPVENVWKMLADIVFDGPEYHECSSFKMNGRETRSFKKINPRYAISSTKSN